MEAGTNKEGYCGYHNRIATARRRRREARNAAAVDLDGDLESDLPDAPTESEILAMAALIRRERTT